MDVALASTPDSTLPLPVEDEQNANNRHPIKTRTTAIAIFFITNSSLSLLNYMCILTLYYKNVKKSTLFYVFAYFSLENPDLLAVFAERNVDIVGGGWGF